MKKIFLTLSLAALGLVKSFGQEIDFQAVVTFDTADLFSGAAFTDTVDRTNHDAIDLYRSQTLSSSYAYVAPTNDSIFGIVGIAYNGPDIIDAGSSLWMVNSYSQYLTAAEAAQAGVGYDSDTARFFWVNGVTFNQDVADPGLLYFLSNEPRYMTDSIGMLANWNTWVDSGLLQLEGPEHDGPFVEGREYGLFMRVYGIGSSVNSIANIDNNPRNNVYVHKIIWKGGGVSVKDMLVKRSVEQLAIYPNPAVSSLNFVYDFKQKTTATVVIRDLTGKAVKVENLGGQKMGEQTFNVDISSLANGNYLIEFQTAETVAVSKFTVAR